MRLVTAAAAVLICWAWTAPLSAIEFINLPISCDFVGNKVMLVPSAGDQLHIIVGDREHKIIKACAPGLANKCRNWEVHRFDLLCGGRRVRWRSIAQQLLSPAPEPARRDALLRARLEPWELRTLRAESEFAPVDELGGRILSFADKSTPRPPSSPPPADTKTVIASEIAAGLSVPPEFEPADAMAKIDAPKVADTFPSFVSDASPPQSGGLISRLPSPPTTSEESKVMGDGAKIASTKPSLDRVEAKPADAVTLSQFNRLRREVNSSSGAGVATAEMAVRDAPISGKSTTRMWIGESFGQFLIMFASALLLTVTALVIYSAVKRWKSVSFHPRMPYGGPVQSAPEAETDAEACRELMKQAATDLVKALSAVNSLRGIPTLQTALQKELDSIRRLLGFTPQARGASGDKKDWTQIKSQLIMGLQGMQRIIGIAEAVRTSFSVHPAALEVITTRLEAYAFLGVNASSSEPVLKKTVNALRQCWHPDLAANEEDRRLREIRIRQINAAWDLISGKQMSAF